MAQPDYSWLPPHQQHVAYTLAHADSLIAQAAEVLFDYLKLGPLELANVADGDLAHVTVAGVAVLPSAVERFAADALTQLRAAIEHTVFAEVEYQLGRGLTDEEARRIEMPACLTEDDFKKWLAGRRRPELEPFRTGSVLAGRIRDLQPYHRRDVDQHPLRVLAEHTNLAKHRTPAVAATLIGAVIPDRQDPTLVLPTGEDRPLVAGDVLASGPRDKYVPLSIWPKVSIQRPHSGTWLVLMTELGEIEEWVRTVAIPHLILGRHDVDPCPNSTPPSGTLTSLPPSWPPVMSPRPPARRSTFKLTSYVTNYPRPSRCTRQVRPGGHPKVDRDARGHRGA